MLPGDVAAAFVLQLSGKVGSVALRRERAGQGPRSGRAGGGRCCGRTGERCWRGGAAGERNVQRDVMRRLGGVWTAMAASSGGNEADFTRQTRTSSYNRERVWQRRDAEQQAAPEADVESAGISPLQTPTEKRKRGRPRGARSAKAAAPPDERVEPRDGANPTTTRGNEQDCNGSRSTPNVGAHRQVAVLVVEDNEAVSAYLSDGARRPLPPDGAPSNNDIGDATSAKAPPRPQPGAPRPLDATRAHRNTAPSNDIGDATSVKAPPRPQPGAPRPLDATRAHRNAPAKGSAPSTVSHPPPRGPLNLTPPKRPTRRLRALERGAPQTQYLRFRRVLRATLLGVVLAESLEYLFMDGRFYFPPGSVNDEYLQSSGEKRMFNPIGKATMYDVVIPKRIRLRKAAWRFEDVRRGDGGAWMRLTGHTAFWKGVRFKFLPQPPEGDRHNN
eukprot:ctg_126.g82